MSVDYHAVLRTPNNRDVIVRAGDDFEDGGRHIWIRPEGLDGDGEFSVSVQELRKAMSTIMRLTREDETEASDE